MFITSSSCEVCGRTIDGRDCLPVVEMKCTACSKQVRVCPMCKRGGCPVCHGRLKKVWNVQAGNMVLVGQVAEGAPLGRERW
ncbi:MAG: hypothetical protein ABC595_07390 [Candidatus Methanosuratincola petrocarbonis]